MSEDNIDLESMLAGLEEEEQSKEESKPKKKRKAPKILAIALSAAIIISGGFYVLNNVDISTEAPNTGNATEESDSPSDESSDAEMKYINREQVIWSTKMCESVGGWKGKIADFPKYDKKENIWKARKDITDTLFKNSKAINEIADSIVNIPQESFNESLEKKKTILITDNFKKMGDSPDERNIETSQKIAQSLRDYAQSLSDMAKDMNSIASYNFDGIRMSINRSRQILEEMNGQLEKDLSSSIGESSYDNVITMSAVSKMPQCNEALIGQDKLAQEMGDELDKQRLIMYYVTTERCHQFNDNAKSVRNPSEELKKNIAACDNFLSKVTFDSNNPVLSGKVDQNNSDREKSGVKAFENKLKDDKEKSSSEETKENEKENN